MSTNATVWLNLPNKLKGIYIHHDGYPSYTGNILVKNYNTIEKIEKLLDLGALSFIGSRLEPNSDEEHKPNNWAPFVTVAYHRDYNEKLYIMEYNVSPDLPIHKRIHQIYRLFKEYNYIFYKDNWYVILQTSLVPLNSMIIL